MAQTLSLLWQNQFKHKPPTLGPKSLELVSFQSIRSLYRYGDEQARIGDEARAIASFKSIISKDKECSQKECLKSYVYLAALAEKNKDFKTALNWLEQLAEKSFHEAAHYYKARLYLNINKTHQAQSELQECLNLNPLELRCHLLFVQVLSDTNADELEDELLNLYGRHPSSVETIKELFNFYMDKEDLTQAMFYLSELSLFEPHNLFIKFQMALHFEMLKKNDVSQDYINQIRIIEPSFINELGLGSRTPAETHD